ncbi:MAG: TraB/GumN family protein [DPANN group archaeon]|nr:TraB/GumN family protein [DPANN group archaeon]
MVENVEKIKVLGKEVILVGTAHISQKSVDLVKETIISETPEHVCVELCEDRYHSIFNKDKWENSKITKIIKDGKSWLFLSNMILSSFERKLGKNVNVAPGSEMVEAINIARKNNIPFELIDRDVQVTLKRTWGLLSLTEKAKLFAGIFAGIFESDSLDEEFIEKLKGSDMLSEVMNEVSKQAPTIKRVLIDERDQYMANQILLLDAKKIVVVVGAGHINGIKSILLKSKKTKKVINIPKDYLVIPKKSILTKYIGYLIPIIFIILLGLSISSGNSTMVYAVIEKWFIINAFFAGLGAVIAMAHPFTIIAAMVVSPFTSLNPAIGAGWIAGLVEVKYREPKVKDFNNLKKIDSIKAFWGNGISRIVLVAALVNLGSSIGSFVALPYIIALLN